MSSHEHSLHDINMMEQCKEPQKILNYYISQQADIINNMNSEKQNEERTKEVLEEQNKLEEKIVECQKLEKANEAMKENFEKELKDRNDLVNVLTSTNELMNNNVENSNLLHNLMQLCVTGQQEANEVKQEFLLNFEEMKRNKVIEENKYIDKINSLKEYLKNIKQERLQSVELIDDLNNKNIEMIYEKKLSIIQLQDQITNVDKYSVKLTEELNDLEKENYDLSKQYSELQNISEETIKQKENEETEYTKRISDLQLNSSSLQERYLNLEKEYNELQKGSDCKNEFLKSLKNQSESSELTLSNLKIKSIETEKEIEEMEEQFQNEMKGYDDKINNLKIQIEETVEQNKCLEETKTNLEQQHSALDYEHNDLKKQIDNIGTDLMKHVEEIKQKEDILNEQDEKFKSEIVVLKKILDEEIQTESNLQNLKEELETKIKELDKQLEELTIKNKEASMEAEEEEVTININIDSVRDEIIKEKYEIELLEKNISKIEANAQEKQQKIKQQYESKIETLNVEVKNMKKNLNDLYKTDQKQKADELRKLNETNSTLDLQISELKTCTQNLQNELNLKVKEIQKLHEQLKDIKSNDNSDKNPNLKRAQYEFKIPEYRIPRPKYSSTSDSSMEERPLLKRRKVTFKRRTPEKKSDVPKGLAQGSQKSVDDIFTDLKSGEHKVAPTRKRSIKKAVF